MAGLRKRDAGVLVSTPVDGGPAVNRRLLRCVHCQHVWVDRPGSGKLRGFCARCAGPVCGRPECVCNGCLHWEKQLDCWEKGVTPGQAPVSVFVTSAPPAT